jgi:hypothetical protein
LFHAAHGGRHPIVVVEDEAPGVVVAFACERGR